MLRSIRPGRCNLLNDLWVVNQVTAAIAVTQDRAVRWSCPKRWQLIGVFESVGLLIWMRNSVDLWMGQAAFATRFAWRSGS